MVLEFKQLVESQMKVVRDALEESTRKLKESMTPEMFAEYQKDMKMYTQLLTDNRHVEAQSLLNKMKEKYS